MSIHLVMHGDIVIVETPGGTISDKALGELETAIRRQVAAGCKKILVDLGKTSFMNSRGIGSLAGLQANAFRNGAALYLCNVDHRIHNVLVILWLTRVLNVLGTREEALAFLTSLDLDLEVDALHLHSARVEKLSTTLAYMWTNHGAAATVQQHTPVAGGTAMIRVRDARGHEVYAHSLADDGDFSTMTGAPGDWRVELDLADYSGPLEFQLQTQ